MKSGENWQAVSYKKTFKDYPVLYRYIAPGHTILIVINKFYYFNHTWYV